MYINIEKFKKGQLYSRPIWITAVRKETLSFDQDEQKVILYIAVKNNKIWTVIQAEYQLGDVMLFDDFIEVADPLHFGKVVKPEPLIATSTSTYIVAPLPISPTLTPPFTVTC